MNKTAIKNFAIQSRVELIQGVTQKAFELGITQENILNNTITSSDTFVVHGKVLDATKKRQREEVIHQIQLKGFSQLIEEVAYTWFNRLIALRFMEVNQYLPSGIRIFTNHINEFKPELLDQALNLTFKDMNRNKVLDYLDQHQEEALYQYLLILQCNEMNRYLPEMFEKIDNYTEVLLPDGLLRSNGVIGNMISMIDESDWKDQVQIIGWIYQYYNTELKQEVFDGLKKNVKITKEKIPAATQLFTPDWIVRYMVENSLGRLWVEGHPNPTLQANWKYYVEEAQQEAEVEKQLQQIREEYKTLKLEDIKVIDPCMGSGHILVYAFDVLMQIYLSVGYLESDAAKLILEKNLYGLDIDRRAYQLAYFSLMMKARQYNRRIFTDGVKPQIYHPAGFHDGEEYGSLVKVDKLEPMPELAKEQQMTLFDGSYDAKLNAWNFKRLLAKKYDVVVTNPPYMGGSGMGAKLSDFVKTNYPDTKSDMFACFIERGNQMTRPNGYNTMVTMQSWMFLSSFEKMRESIIATKTISNLMHMENMVMGIAFGTAVANFRNTTLKGYKGTYNHVTMKDIGDDDVPVEFPVNRNRFAQVSTENFSKIPGSPIAYWVSEAIQDIFHKNKKIDDIANPRQGLATGNNDHYLRFWAEVAFPDFVFNCSNLQQFFDTGAKYVPYNKGGAFRKWYGNIENVIRFDKANYDILQTVGNHLPSKEFYFKESITWSKVTSGGFSMRYVPKGSVFDVAGCSIFSDSRLKYLLGLSNCALMQYLMNVLSQTLNYEVGSVKSIPIIFDSNRNEVVERIVNQCISLSHSDWDAFETSWGFKRHPFLCGERTVASSFGKWEREAKERVDTLKANEEELNRIFIDIYGLQNELNPEVEEEDVTVRKADLTRDVKSFISYIIGCVFGRYSLDEEGLIYAGGEWNDSRYSTFKPVKDNIIVINEDIFDEHSLLGKVIEFVKIVYGESTLEENLSFIAFALGTSGQSAREKISKYLLNDFYKDHVKTYQKRPIYWLFDSGKANGFKALIYLHRYSSETLVKLRLDYVHPTQDALRSEISTVSREFERTSDARLKAKYVTQLKDIKDKADEVLKYEQKLHHLVDKKIVLDLDDGVVVNYAKFEDLVAKIK